MIEARSGPLFGALAGSSSRYHGNLLLGRECGRIFLAQRSQMTFASQARDRRPTRSKRGTQQRFPSRPPSPRERLTARVWHRPRERCQARRASVAVIGVSGGGSHVVQQLGPSRSWTVIPVDDQTVDESNPGGSWSHRSRHRQDAEGGPRVPRRHWDRPVDSRQPRGRTVPSRAAIEQLREADVVVRASTVRYPRGRQCLLPALSIPPDRYWDGDPHHGERLATADGPSHSPRFRACPACAAGSSPDVVLDREACKARARLIRTDPG